MVYCQFICLCVQTDNILRAIMSNEEPDLWVMLAAQRTGRADCEQRLDELQIFDQQKEQQKQMALEESERNRLDQIKLEEKQTAEREVYAAFNELERKEAEKKNKKEVHFGGTSEPHKAAGDLYDID